MYEIGLLPLFGFALQSQYNMMMSSHFPNIIGHYRPGKEFLWLVSVFSGIIICKIVYELTGFISLSCFKTYGKLSDAEKIEWNNRGFSTFHALVVALASMYLFLLSDLFNENFIDDLIINRTSAVSDITLGISIGYFLSDLAMILWHFPALGGLQYVLHHGLSMFSIFLSGISGQGQIYILMVLFSESTTPFVNLRWYLDVAGQKRSKIYVFNGVALFVGWLVLLKTSHNLFMILLIFGSFTSMNGYGNGNSLAMTQSG